MKIIRKILGDKVYDAIWSKSHDAIESIKSLSELYDNVPDNLKDKNVYVTELHQFEESDKDEIIKWLNRDEKEVFQEKKKDKNLILKCALATYYEHINMIYDRGKHKEHDEEIQEILKTIKELQGEHGKASDEDKKEGWVF